MNECIIFEMKYFWFRQSQNLSKAKTRNRRCYMLDVCVENDRTPKTCLRRLVVHDQVDIHKTEALWSNEPA